MNLLTRPKHIRESAESERAGYPNRRWLAASIAALVLPVAITGIILHYRSVPSPPNLGLNVTREAGQLVVNWDHKAPEILRARRGVLAIRDGSFEHHFELDPLQLRSGSLAYASAGADIQFSLEVFRDRSRSLSASIRLLKPKDMGRPDTGRMPAEASGKTGGTLGATYYYKLGREQAGRNDFQEALRSLNQAIELDPQRATSYNARGYVYLRVQSYANAIVEFSEAIRLRPDYTNAYQNRAAARRHAGDEKGAAEDIRRATELENLLE
jgi:tetratricopeptide (TPR) repeat protein